MTDRPLSPEQITSWKRPAGPQISPDGKKVVFVLSDSGTPDEHERSTLWMVDSTSGRTWQFTNGPRADTSSRWSPNGTRIAFVSDRRDPSSSGLYVIDAHGGEAIRLGGRQRSISSPLWSPDGATLAYLAEDEESDEEVRRKKERRDEIVVQTNYKYGRLYLVPAAGGSPRRLSPDGDYHIKAIDWLPDGLGLLFLRVSSPLIDDVGRGPTDLVIVRLDGTVRPVAHLSSVNDPQISPDGTWLAYLAAAGRVQDGGALWLVPLAAGEPRCLTPAYAGTVSSFVWSADSQQIHFAGFENLHGVLRTVDLDGGIQPLLARDEPCGTYESDMSFDRMASRFAVIRSTSDQPPNLWTGTVGGEMRRITDLNADLARRRFIKAEHISWESSDGLIIQGLLFRPTGYVEKRSYPLVVHIHGGPAMQWSDRFMGYYNHWAQWLAQRGYAVLLPNPRGSTGRGAPFTDLEANDYGGLEVDDILSGVDDLIKRGIAHPERTAVAGWSHGGYMTARIITQTDRFRCAIMGAGCSNLISDQGQSDIPRFNDDFFDVTVYEDPKRYLQRSPIRRIGHVRTPTLILHGERDTRVTMAQSLEMYRGLKWAGVETELVIYPREGHSIRERSHQMDMVERILDWFERHLQPPN